MNILLLGSSGFLGSNIKKFLLKKNKFNLITPSRDELFMDKKISTDAKNYLKNAEIIINCIADIDFNSCANSKINFANIEVPKIINKISNKNSYKIHFSTDAMYESKRNQSDEFSVTREENDYVKQKILSEKYFSTNSVILRTSFVGMNPKKTGMLNYLVDSFKHNQQIDGWIDVFTSSVHVEHICKLILKLIIKKPVGIFNFGTDKPYSKYSYISEICEVFGREALVKKVLSPLADNRNKNCGMNSENIKKVLRIELPTFKNVINKSIGDIKNVNDA